MFESIQLASPDPILGLVDIITADKRSEKINLGIGVYKDEYGNTPILLSVKKAELFLIKNEVTKNYLNIEGIEKFNQSTQELLFGLNNSPVDKNRIRTVQTPGGTGALRIAADFLKQNTNAKRVWISKPTWINHKNIFSSAGFEILHYPYYDYNTHTLDFEKIFETLSNAKSNDIIIFHGCCHNPTGTDLNIEQWITLSELSIKNNWLPLFDFAYQGFGSNLKDDLSALNAFCDSHQELIICNSYSKNFNLYNERIGACTLISPNEKIAKKVFSQLKSVIRSNYSNPPSHGGAIVTKILNDDFLRPMWEKELENMRIHINNTRALFVQTLQKMSQKRNFDFINQQKGMFSFIGLHEHQVKKLQKESGIYMSDSGRINICGITKNNVHYLCEKLLNIK